MRAKVMPLTLDEGAAYALLPLSGISSSDGHVLYSGAATVAGATA